MGLSAAYAALRAGWRVQILDRALAPTQASWAGAGLITAANPERASHPLERLCGLSNAIYDRWSRDLLAETGIDNEYTRCGGFHIARSRGDAAALAGALVEWHDNGVEARWVEREELCAAFGPGFDPKHSVLRAAHVPDERQVRNPRHLLALRKAIRQRGGELVELAAEIRLVRCDSRLIVQMPDGNELTGETLCLCAGAWSQQLLEPCGIRLPITPIRGQMLLYHLDRPLFSSILYEGSRYVVPRRDGHVLVGATVEEAGFDCDTTVAGVEELRHFAASCHAALGPKRMARSWAGLRPASFDGLPYLGRLNGIDNAVVATAQFRNGLQLAPVFAELALDLLRGETLPSEFDIFSLDRLAKV